MDQGEISSESKPCKVQEDDYVFIVSSINGGKDNRDNDYNTKDNLITENNDVALKSIPTPTCFTIEEAPTSIPFLPLDASTEITKHGGYSEAVASAQKFLDSRLESYSQYQQMVSELEEKNIPNDSLLAPRNLDFETSTTAVEIDVKNDLSPDAGIELGTDDFFQYEDIGLGWRNVKHVDDHSRNLLRKLELDGVMYTPHETAYNVKYLQPVSPNGDCLFLSVEQLLKHAVDPGIKNLNPAQIRELAVKSFWAHYEQSAPSEKQKIDSTICNLYLPDLRHGWGVSHVQSRRYVVPLVDKDLLVAKIFQRQDQGISWDLAAEQVYSKYAKPVANAETYCQYMLIGHRGNGDVNTHFLVTLHYSRNGLISVDNDGESRQVSWGDDIVLEELATAFQRDIFVVLVGGGKMFFLPHRPRKVKNRSHSKNDHPVHAPWFLLMRSTGADRGGDHYEPMFSRCIQGNASTSFGSIGD